VRPGLSEAEIRRLLTHQEGQFLEFKSLWDQSGEKRRAVKRAAVRSWIGEYCAAFANADGGTVLLGVEDDGTVSGHDYPVEVVEDFRAVPLRRLRPPLEVRSREVRIDGERILVMEVPRSHEAVMFEGDGFPYRTSDAVIHEPQEVINERKQAYRRVGHEQRVRVDATLDDLDLQLASSFLAGAPRIGTPEEILVDYGLLLPRSGGFGVTNAALLLFARRPVQWHPRAGLRVFKVRGAERLHGKYRNVEQVGRLELPIATLIPEARRLVASQIRRSERLHSLFFREMPEYPEFAWQEGLVNAVAHRDYGQQGREIEVWFFDDRLEIESPGDLVPPVTLEGLQAREKLHASRNPLLVRVLAECKIMREEGEGIPRMFDEMEESFLRPPQFAVRQGTFQVSLFNSPVFEGPSAAWKLILDQLSLSSSQRRVLIAYPDGFGTTEYRSLNGVDRDQAYREIQDLVNREFLLPAEGSGRGATYAPAPHLLERRRWLESRLPAIRSFLDTHPFLRNADYREMFDLSRHEALKELRRLVSAGLLVLEGERRGSKYRPGPQLSDPG